MQPESVLKKHAGLVDRMSDTLGVDLQEQALRGAVSLDEISDAVLRCTGCTQPEACDSWLNTREGIEETPPSYCRNAELFADLKLP